MAVAAPIVMQEPRLLSDQLATLDGPDIRVWLSNNGQWIGLNWINSGAVGYWDWVGLYDHQPTDPDNYLTYQYTMNQTSPYVTWYAAKGTDDPDYWIAYVGWDYSSKSYKILAWAGPSKP